MESLIGWFVPIFGIPVCWYWQKRLPETSTEKKILSALGKSIVVMFAFIFVSSFANTFCIEFLKLCKSHGDMNMSYWFNSFFLFPAYLIAAIAKVNSNMPNQSLHSDAPKARR